MTNYITLIATCKDVKPYKKDKNSDEKYITNFIVSCSTDIIDIFCEENIYIEGMQYVILLEATRFGLKAKVLCPYNN